MRGIGRGQVAVVLCVLGLGILPAGSGVPVAFSAPPVDRGPLSLHLPDPVPTRAQRPGWEQINGEIETGSATVRYSLFVNPAFNGLYQITQYRMWRTNGSEAETEKVVWNEAPGTRQPLRIFELLQGRWVVIAHDTPAYRREILHVIRIYDLHRQAHGYDAGFGAR